MAIHILVIIIIICSYCVLKKYKIHIKHIIFKRFSAITTFLLVLVNFYTGDCLVHTAVFAFCLRTFITPLLGVRYVLKNKENLPEEGPYIMVANHPTRFDTLGIAFLMQFIKKWKIVAAELLKQCTSYRLGLPLCSFHFVPLKNTEMAVEILDKLALEAKTDKSVIHIRPEGLSREDGTVHEFKKGAFHLAIKHKLPIVPVVYSKHDFYDINLGVVYITVLPAIQTENLTKSDVSRLTEFTRNLIVKNFN